MLRRTMDDMPCNTTGRRSVGRSVFDRKLVYCSKTSVALVTSPTTLPPTPIQTCSLLQPAVRGLGVRSTPS